MANGFSLGILQMMKEVTKDATPAYKVEPYGMLASLLSAHSPGVIKNDSYDGHFKTVKVKKKKRLTMSDTETSASCDIGAPIPYTEDTVTINGYRRVAFHLEDEVVAAFDAYASAPVQVPGMISPLMFEFFDSLQVACNGILEGVNNDIVTLALANNGKNRVSGNTTAQTINIPLSWTNNDLAAGVTKLLSDFKLNNMSGKPIIVGAGLMHNFMLQQAAVRGNNFNGIDTRIQGAGIDFFLDYQLPTIASAANQIMVYEKDAVQIVEYMEYQGFKAGPKPGASQFGVITLPMMNPDGTKVPVKFDFQLRYNDCAVTETNAYGDPQTYQKGYNLIISKQFGLYTIPTTAYSASDVLSGNRGSLKYNITNS